MKRKSWRVTLTATVALTMTSTTVFSDARDTIAVPDSTGSVGLHTSVVLDRSGIPVISYYNAKSDDLRLLRCGEPSCVTNGTVTTLDAVDDVGRFSSLALDASGFPVVAYHDTTRGDLKVLRCNDAMCAGDNESVTRPDTVGIVGEYSSLVLDASGNPVVSYYDATNGDLKVLHCNDPACAPGGDSVRVVDSLGFTGLYSSLVLDAGGAPVVSYFDSSKGDLKVAHCADPNCATGSTISAVDGVGVGGPIVGLYTSLALDASGYPVVSYFDMTNGDLKVLHCNDPACVGGDESVTRPDAAGTVGEYSALVLDTSGFPVVSYFDGSNRHLKVLHCNDSACAGGDDSMQTPDATSGVGRYPSIVLDSDGFPIISYYDSVREDLRVLRCGDPDCAPQVTDFVSLLPARLLDTRVGERTADRQFEGIGIRAARSTVRLPIAERAGVPSDATAVAINVTAVDTAATGYVTVFRCDQKRPVASNLNTVVGKTVPNSVVASLDPDGDICLYTLTKTELIVDVTGYFPADTTFESRNPARLLDTRVGATTFDGLGAGAGITGPGQVTAIQVSGRAGVPSAATAAAVNLTLTQTTGPNYATVFPCGEKRPLASNINVVGSGETIANSAIVRLSADGRLCIFTLTSTHLVVDLAGWLIATSDYEPLIGARLLDTRPDSKTLDSESQAIGLVPDKKTVVLQVAGRGGAGTNVGSVVINVTVTEARGPGYITVYPCDRPRPVASNLNYSAGSTVANNVITATSAAGTVCLYALRSTHLVADLNGTFAR